MKTIVSAGLAFAGLTLAVPTAAAQGQSGQRSECALKIDTGSTNWFIQGYDPFGTITPIATFDAIFTNDGGAACVFDPVFVIDQGGAFGLTTIGRNVRVTYTLLDQFSNSNVTPTSGRTIAGATRRPVVVQPRSQQLVRYQFAVDEDGLTGDGLYSQPVTLVAERRGQGEVLASRSLVLGVNVLPSAVLGLSGQFTRVGGQALIDLGELRPGVAQVPLQVMVSSTRAYRLEFTSKNLGNLKIGDSEWKVPYGVGVGDQTLSLTTRAIYESNESNPAGMSLPLKFLIGPTAGMRAGTYSDVLTVAIQPK